MTPRRRSVELCTGTPALYGGVRMRMAPRWGGEGACGAVVAMVGNPRIIGVDRTRWQADVLADAS